MNGKPASLASLPTETRVCPSCATPVQIAPGIGPYCPNKDCWRCDDLRPESMKTSGRSRVIQYYSVLVERLKMIAATITSRPVLGHWPAMVAESDVKLLLNAAAYIERMERMTSNQAASSSLGDDASTPLARGNLPNSLAASTEDETSPDLPEYTAEKLSDNFPNRVDHTLLSGPYTPLYLARAYRDAAKDLETQRDQLQEKLRLREIALRLIAAGPPLAMGNDSVAAWAAFVAQEGLSS